MTPEEHERFTDILRDRLPAYHIANVGVTAYGTDQEYLLLERVWDRIRPNVVVLMVCVDNDRIENTTKTLIAATARCGHDPSLRTSACAAAGKNFILAQAGS